MSDQEPALSPDLQWMLQSGQVDEATLTNRLVHEQFANLYRLALTILRDPEEAMAGCRASICRAVLERHRYSGKVHLETWLSNITKKVCQSRLRRQSLQNFPAPQSSLSRKELGDQRQRTHQQGQEFSPGELNRLAEEIHAAIEKERRRKRLLVRFQEIALIAVASLLVILAGRAIDATAPMPAPVGPSIKKAVVTQGILITPSAPPAATPTSFPERAVLYEARPGDTLEKISAQVGVDVEILSSLNSVPPGQQLDPGQEVMIGVGAPPLSLITPTPVIPAPLLEPLTAQSWYEEIHQRIQESKNNWHTLWADTLEFDYGPPGYVGPPRMTRYQVWISQPAYGLLLAGDASNPNGNLSQVWRKVSNKLYSLDLETGDTGSFVYGWLGFADVLSGMLYPERFIYSSYPHSRFPAEGEMKNLRADQIAGRDALVFDWHADDPFDRSGQQSYLGRFWIDTITGVILRWQQFDRDNPEPLLKDLVVVDLVFDANFSNDLFDPHQPFPTRFASDYQGTPEPFDRTLSMPDGIALSGREPLLRTAVPPDFDPSGRRLFFQWTDGSAYDADQSARTDVFADGYYLGTVEFVYLNNSVMCSRSPDGQLIAFSEWLPESRRTAPLNWFRLLDLSEVHQPLPKLSADDFVFSPDGGRLALIACEGEAIKDCWLYTIDTATDEAEKIIDLYSGYSLAWSPDASQLAFIGILKGAAATGQEIIVVDVKSREVIYTVKMDWQTNSPPPDSPVNAWGVQFPRRTAGLEGCVAPS